MADMDPEAFAQMATGPNTFAFGWYKAIYNYDVDAVWVAMSDDFRLAMVQGVVLNYPELVAEDENSDGVVTDLLRGAHPEAGAVRAGILKQIRNVYDEVPPADLAMGSRPRPIGPDLELVRLWHLDDVTEHPDGSFTLDPGNSARSVNVLVEGASRETWRVAGVGDSILRPGWPPQLQRMIDPGD